jgi:hypothetical protein
LLGALCGSLQRTGRFLIGGHRLRDAFL